MATVNGLDIFRLNPSRRATDFNEQFRSRPMPVAAVVVFGPPNLNGGDRRRRQQVHRVVHFRTSRTGYWDQRHDRCALFGIGGDITVTSGAFVGVLGLTDARPDISTDAPVSVGAFAVSQPSVDGDVSVSSLVAVGVRLGSDGTTITVSASSSAFLGTRAGASPTIDVSTGSLLEVGIPLRSAPTVEVPASATAHLGAVARSGGALHEVGAAARTLVGALTHSTPTIAISAAARALAGALGYALITTGVVVLGRARGTTAAASARATLGLARTTGTTSSATATGSLSED